MAAMKSRENALFVGQKVSFNSCKYQTKSPLTPADQLSNNLGNRASKYKNISFDTKNWSWKGEISKGGCERRARFLQCSWRRADIWGSCPGDGGGGMKSLGRQKNNVVNHFSL